MRLTAIVLAVVLLAAPLAAEAQQTGTVFRIGYLDPSSQSSHNTFLPVFRKALGEVGYVEGKNPVLEQRYAGDRPGRDHLALKTRFGACVNRP